MRIPAFFLLVSFVVSVSANEPLPNIVLMMADDMGMGDTSAYQDITGNTDQWQIHTPNMERVARMGIRFTDAHTPSSRCTGTRYGLMTGRYPWRNRLKHFVLFGVQGDPMIERDRPTIASLLKDKGYQTGMVGKWHVGLRYRQSGGEPAAGWEDADLTQPIFDGPTDHGFDYCRYTSRSHGTSGASTGFKKAKNSTTQSVGPGHIHDRTIVSATGDGKRLKSDSDPDAYRLDKLGSRHSDHSIEFLQKCVASDNQSKPFFLYYASNSNHSPYTPDEKIGGKPVRDASRNVGGNVMPAWKKPNAKNPSATKPNAAKDARHDFIYENDVVLGRLMDHLQNTDDPRRPGHPLIENTIIIFTSDNGAERKADYATGPFRSNKGSAYEGGHRVPLMISWPAGGVGNGNDSTPGNSSDQLIALQDMFATFSEITGTPMPDWRNGEKGGEDSTSMLAAWRGEKTTRSPLFHNDHNEAKDKATMAMRIDDPSVLSKTYEGQWKILFDASLIRHGQANPIELYNLTVDPGEKKNQIDNWTLKPLVSHLSSVAKRHRLLGGHQLASLSVKKAIRLTWSREFNTKSAIDMRKQFSSENSGKITIDLSEENNSLEMLFSAVRASTPIDIKAFDVNDRGLGIIGGRVKQVDDEESLTISFDQDVLIESVAIAAGNGNAGGVYQVGDKAPLAIYCIDDDIDYNDQSGILSDIGVLKAGEALTLSSSPHYGVEASGRWRLGAMTLRVLESDVRELSGE